MAQNRNYKHADKYIESFGATKLYGYYLQI